MVDALLDAPEHLEVGNKVVAAAASPLTDEKVQALSANIIDLEVKNRESVQARGELASLSKLLGKVATTAPQTSASPPLVIEAVARDSWVVQVARDTTLAYAEHEAKKVRGANMDVRIYFVDTVYYTTAGPFDDRPAALAAKELLSKRFEHALLVRRADGICSRYLPLRGKDDRVLICQPAALLGTRPPM